MIDWHNIEFWATLSGVMTIYLAAKASLWNWIFGIIMVTLYAVIFFRVKLYADMSLQVIYFILQLYGLYQWSQNGPNQADILIKKCSSATFVGCLVMVLLLFIPIATLLYRYTDSQTILIDAFASATSLVAQWMMIRKWIENWWLWMIVNVVSIFMYAQKNLLLTSGLYSLFFLLNFYGYAVWLKKCSVITKKPL